MPVKDIEWFEVWVWVLEAADSVGVPGPMHNAVYGLSRILLPRTWVNKFPYHYADPFIDASSLRINMRV
jgi:hypothetical protein